MGQKFKIRSKTSKIPSKTWDSLGLNVIDSDTAESSFC